jgi:hypothetical protein
MKEKPGSILLISFLRQLKKADKPAYFVAIIIIVLQLLFTFMKLEITPFFLYGMFSEKIPARDSLTLVQILVNNKPLQDYHPGYRELLLLQTAQENYALLKDQHFIDPVKTRMESKFKGIDQMPGYKSLSPKMYNQPGINEPFRHWFKARCLTAAKLSAGIVTVTKTQLLFNRKTFSFTKTGYEILEQF